MSLKQLYRGNREIAIQYWRDDNDSSYKRRMRKLLKWALSVKVGDYIGTCEGCNRKVTEIAPEFVELEEFIDVEESGDGESHLVIGSSDGEFKPTDTEILREVQFTDTNGRWHHCPGGGCAYPAETPEQVTAFFREWAFDPKREERIRHWWGDKDQELQQALDDWQQMLAAFKAGEPIVDEHGELLPKFDRARV